MVEPWPILRDLAGALLIQVLAGVVLFSVVSDERRPRTGAARAERHGEPPTTQRGGESSVAGREGHRQLRADDRLRHLDAGGHVAAASQP